LFESFFVAKGDQSETFLTVPLDLSQVIRSFYQTVVKADQRQSVWFWFRGEGLARTSSSVL
jgi:hypothetical protein